MKPYTREELDTLQEEVIHKLFNGPTTRAELLDVFDRLLATAKAGLLDAAENIALRERLSKDHNPFSLEALDGENEALRADLDWLSQNITNIDWNRYQNGDDIRAIIAERRSTSSGHGASDG